MGNIGNTLKRFVGNKNTVTILGVVAGVIVLWVFYSYRVNQATNPTKVPYAIETIEATEEIKEDNIGWVEVNSSFLKTADIHTSTQAVVGQYVTTGTSIPAGGLFYKLQVVSKSEIPNTIFDEIPENYTIYSLSVNNHTTYGNSIYPGDKIDLYLKAEDEEGAVMFGKFIEYITVLAVRDSNGKNVFQTSETRAPAELLFAVNNDYYELLMKSGYVGGITILPVPRNRGSICEGDESDCQLVTSSYLKEFILQQTAEIPEEIDSDDGVIVTDDTSDQTNNNQQNKDNNKDNNKDKNKN